MLNILLLILKIILWIILGIIGLILLLLLLVLLCPIRYKADVKYKDKARVKAKIRYLIVSVMVTYDQATKDVSKVIRIFGFRIGKKKEKTPSLEENLEYAEPNVIATTDETNIDENINDETNTDLTNTEETLSYDEFSEFDASEPFDLDKEELPKEEKKVTGRLKKLITGFSGWWEEHKPSKLVEKYEKKKNIIDKKIQMMKRFWNLKCTTKTRNYLKKYLKSLPKHILPRKVKGYVHYGMKDAYTTGRVTGYLSLCSFVHQKKLLIEPDFYQKIMECDVNLKGHIRLGYIIRIALNVNVWKTLKAFKRLSAKVKG